jgi:phage shock protein C
MAYVRVKHYFFGGNRMSQNRAPLRRSRRNRVIAGVCGGLAEFFGISAFWFRLAFLIALIPGGVPGVGAYLLFWIIVPNASD